MLCLLAVAAPGAAAQETSAAEHDAAVERGLVYLARTQGRDGSWEGGGPKVAMTGLSLMAFLSAGQVPEVGRHGVVVRNAIDFLLRQAPDDGYWGSLDNSRMYGQGIVTLALAEAYGVEPDEARRRRMLVALRRGVKVILDAQAVEKQPPHAGGWRYEPKSPDSDLSLSGWNALALRACQNIGVEVPKEAVDQAVAYVLKCYREDGGGFAYQPGQNATASMTGVGVLNLYLLSDGEHEAALAARQLLSETRIEQRTRFAYYALYYTTQAAFQLGEPVWGTVWSRTRQLLIGLQEEDGGWPASTTAEEPGRVYTTSMSVLTLTVPYRLLPTYQR